MRPGGSENLDREHGALSADWAQPQRGPGELLAAVTVVAGLFWYSRIIGGRHGEKLTASSEFLFAVTVAEKAVVANTLESIRQDVKQKPPDKLGGGKSHGFVLIIVAIILPMEGDPVVFDIRDAIVGDGHAVSIAADVVEDLFGSGERRFGIDHPFRLPYGIEIQIPLVRAGQFFQRAREL